MACGILVCMPNQAKLRYFQKVYDSAIEILCECGCGERIKSFDKYARPKRFVSGHNNRKYQDKTQYKREWNHRNRKSRYEWKAEYLHNLKSSLIRSKGGGCVMCGLQYNGKNASVFDFHHTRDKKFTLSVGNLNKKSKQEVVLEADKCTILCANCHRQHHSSDY